MWGYRACRAHVGDSVQQAGRQADRQPDASAAQEAAPAHLGWRPPHQCCISHLPLLHPRLHPGGRIAAATTGDGCCLAQGRQGQLGWGGGLRQEAQLATDAGSHLFRQMRTAGGRVGWENVVAGVEAGAVVHRHEQVVSQRWGGDVLLVWVGVQQLCCTLRPSCPDPASAHPPIPESQHT